MNVTSISLSYWFLGISLISLLFSLYFKNLVIKTSPGNKSRDKIIGTMKDPMAWREKNNILAYISIFWTVVSLLLFIYFKFLNASQLISIYYVFAYVAIIALSLILIKVKSKSSE
ncbi:hypothetical protein [Clostridium hydrogenum]|uniref:hypothetical protein n=1 Tax=Clostridium hydrogenum TaxID=2855764 RepID=UPI002E2FAF3C|nr:hypothetical protein [Clostridium hydrogenum]